MSLWIYWHQCSWSYVDRLFLMAVPDKVIGWFSNRTGTSVDDDARKSSFPCTFPSSNDVPVLLLNQPITFNLKTPLCKTITSYFNWLLSYGILFVHLSPLVVSLVRNLLSSLFTAISRKVVGKMCTRQSRKVIRDMIFYQCTVPHTWAVEPTFVALL